MLWETSMQGSIKHVCTKSRPNRKKQKCMDKRGGPRSMERRKSCVIRYTVTCGFRS